MPGVGKTSLARKVLQLELVNYDYTFIVSAESSSKMLQDITEIGRMLGLGKEVADVNHKKALVLDHLSKSSYVFPWPNLGTLDANKV